MAELNGTAAFEVEFLEGLSRRAYNRGYLVGIYSVLIAVANEGTEAALKDAEEVASKFIVEDKTLNEELEKELAAARARKNDN